MKVIFGVLLITVFVAAKPQEGGSNDLENQCRRQVDSLIGEYSRDAIKSAIETNQVQKQDYGSVLCCVKRFFDPEINTFNFNCREELQVFAEQSFGDPIQGGLVPGEEGEPVADPLDDPRRPGFGQGRPLGPRPGRPLGPRPGGAFGPRPGSAFGPRPGRPNIIGGGVGVGSPSLLPAVMGALQNPFSILKGFQQPGVASAGPGTFAGNGIACAGGICAGGPLPNQYPQQPNQYPQQPNPYAAEGGAAYSGSFNGPLYDSPSATNTYNTAAVSTNGGGTAQYDTNRQISNDPNVLSGAAAAGAAFSDSGSGGRGSFVSYSSQNGVGSGIVGTSDGNVRQFGTGPSRGGVFSDPSQLSAGLFSTGGDGVAVTNVDGQMRVYKLGDNTERNSIRVASDPIGESAVLHSSGGSGVVSTGPGSVGAGFTSPGGKSTVVKSKHGVAVLSTS